MRFSKVIIVLNIALTFLISSCVSHKIWVQETTHNEQVHIVHHAFYTLPRKLKHHDTEANVQTVGNRHYLPFKMKGEEALPMPGKLQDKEFVGEEGMIDPSQFFTMDYHPVRRRQPIHNTFVPMAP